jgi:hypothetical protein
MEKAALEHWREVIKDTVLRAVRVELSVAAVADKENNRSAA